MQLAKDLDGERSTDTQVFFAPPREWHVARLQILSANPALLVFAERLSRTRSTAGAAAARSGRSMDVTANAGRSGGRARDCRWAGLLRPRRPSKHQTSAMTPCVGKQVVLAHRALSAKRWSRVGARRQQPRGVCRSAPGVR